MNKDFKFVFPEECKEYIYLQVTQMTDNPNFYDELSKYEYDSTKVYLSNPTKILELGCGMGRSSVYLNSQLKRKAHFTLADFSERSEKIKYGWNAKDSYYNDLSLTRKFCESNGLHNFDCFNLKERDLKELRNINLVMSFLSVGFHYPIEDYIDILKHITTKHCVFVFGVRKGSYDEKTLSDHFSYSKVIKSENINTKQDFLILKK